MKTEYAVYALTALAALVVVLTRLRLGRGSAPGRQHVGSGILNIHTVCGLLALAGWLVYLVGADDLIGIVALAFWWLTTFVGLLMLLRWLPSRGRHAEARGDHSWAAGPGLSILAHLGLLACVLVFTWYYASR